MDHCGFGNGLPEKQIIHSMYKIRKCTEGTACLRMMRVTVEETEGERQRRKEETEVTDQHWGAAEAMSKLTVSPCLKWKDESSRMGM